MKTIVCLGNATWDSFYKVPEIPSEATKYFSTHYDEAGGGVAATAAVAIARLGANATMISRVGDDNVGQKIIDDLKSWRVDTQYVRKFDGCISSNAVVHVDSVGERQITVHRDKGMLLDPHWIPSDVLGSANCILCDCTWFEGLQYLTGLAKSLGIPSVIDADLGGVDLAKVVPLGDHIAFSYPALCTFTGKDDIAEALIEAQRLTEGVVYVTNGSDGCFWLENSQLMHEPTFHVDIVDTTGAGDVFHGALAVAIAEGMRSREAVRFANASAAIKCTMPGGRDGIPERAYVNSFIEKYSQ